MPIVLEGLVCVQEVVIVGGLEMQQQAKALARRPHVVVATPGRLKVWVLQHTYSLLQRLHRRTESMVRCTHLSCRGTPATVRLCLTCHVLPNAQHVLTTCSAASNLPLPTMYLMLQHEHVQHLCYTAMYRSSSSCCFYSMLRPVPGADLPGFFVSTYV